MPPLAGWSMLVLDEVDVVGHQRNEGGTTRAVHNALRPSLNEG